MTVFEKIEAQQKGKENSAVWMCGEQLKDICRSDPHCAEIVCQDLDVPEMSIAACEKKIKAYADQHKPGPHAKSSCTPPNVAEGIIRKFYGLPEVSAAPTAAVLGQLVEQPTLRLLDLL